MDSSFIYLARNLLINVDLPVSHVAWVTSRFMLAVVDSYISNISMKVRVIFEKSITVILEIK